jgi:hypothetical protein
MKEGREKEEEERRMEEEEGVAQVTQRAVVQVLHAEQAIRRPNIYTYVYMYVHIYGII